MLLCDSLNAVLQLWFPLYLNDGGSGLRHKEHPDLKLSFVGGA